MGVVAVAVNRGNGRAGHPAVRRPYRVWRKFAPGVAAVLAEVVVAVNRQLDPPAQPAVRLPYRVCRTLAPEVAALAAATITAASSSNPRSPTTKARWPRTCRS